MLRVLLTSAVGSLICKRRLIAFLRFAFSWNFYQPWMGAQIQEWAGGLLKPYCWIWLLVCSPRIFRLLDLRWEPHSIDRFADEHNHLLPRSDFRFWSPCCETMDTFTRSWGFDNNWICPPPNLVLGALKHMRPCCPQGSLIAPLRRSAPFWPLLVSDGLQLAHFVEDWVDLPPLKTSFCIGRHNTGVFFWQRGS